MMANARTGEQPHRRRQHRRHPLRAVPPRTRVVGFVRPRCRRARLFEQPHDRRPVAAAAGFQADRMVALQHQGQALPARRVGRLLQNGSG